MATSLENLGCTCQTLAAQGLARAVSTIWFKVKIAKFFSQEVLIAQQIKEEVYLAASSSIVDPQDKGSQTHATIPGDGVNVKRIYMEPDSKGRNLKQHREVYQKNADEAKHRGTETEQLNKNPNRQNQDSFNMLQK